MEGSFRKFVVAAATILISSVAVAQANAHPGLAGTWTLDVSKSDQGPLTPQALSYVVEQNGDQLHVVRDVTNQLGHSVSSQVYGIDGKPYKNAFKQGEVDVTLTSVLSWDGSTLVFKNVLSQQGQEAHQTDRWTVAPDGKTMTIERSVEAGGQLITGRLVLSRS